MPIVADAAVRVAADMKPFEQDLRAGGDRATRTLGDQLKSVFSPRNLAVAGVAGGIALAGAITAGLAGAAKALIDIERLNAQTDAAIRSTGGVAGVTRQGIEDLSESMEELTTVERETVQEGANLLLTFTRVRNVAGEGNDIFNQATETALDLSVALGTDMRSASMMLGKALNDPIAGVTALTRAGVQLTAQQKEQIAAFVESGDILSAQKIILAELETQVGGSAEAFAGTTAGKIQRFQNDIGNMFESIVLGAVEVADTFGSVAESAGNGFEAIGDVLSTEIITWEGLFGEGVDDVETQMNRMPDIALFAASSAARNVSDEFEKGGPVIAKEAGKIAGLLPHEITARNEEIRAAGRENVVQFAAGMLDKQQDPLLAMEALARANEQVLSRSAEISRLLGQLNSAELAAGLADGRPEVRAAAEAAAGVIEDRLRELGAWEWGYRTGADFAAGLWYSYPLVDGAARGISSAVGRQIGIRSEPEASDSGLRGITKWGGNIVKTIAEGIYGELSTGSSAANALSGALMPNLRTPDAFPAGNAVGMGNVIQYILNVEGRPPVVGTKDDVLDRWQQETSLSRDGVQ